MPAAALEGREFIGELGLNGELRHVPGILPAAIAGATIGRALFAPKVDAPEGALVKNARVFGIDNLLELCAYLHGRIELRPMAPVEFIDPEIPLQLGEVRGQAQAKRALAIAAAGNHNLLLLGPPGTGKTMLASRLPGLLPPLTEAEQLEVAAVHSVAGERRFVLSKERPFRAPHHTASGVALVGGGSNPRPGEISLAHHGVLFLDELPEFERGVLEVLREPLESGEIVIARANRRIAYPARFQLVAAMNPCPCGYHGDREHHCQCSPDHIRRYRSRVSGPLLDRIDLHVPVARLPKGALSQPSAEADDGSALRESILRARERQMRRQQKVNAHLSGPEIDSGGRISVDNRSLLEEDVAKLGLSARAFYRVLKVACTIADLEESDAVEQIHIREALYYRALDRKTPG